jgi:biopolymer transport protein ExbD
MHISLKRKRYDQINITPMVDLFMVLLIIFMILCTAGVQGYKVNLPQASTRQSIAQPTTKAIAVNSEGKIYLDTVPVTLEQLESQLRSWKAQTPDFPVVIRGDSATQYQGIMDVMSVLGRLQITQVGLASKSSR